ncbi:two-component system, OmpR family, sensor histidine kinase MtrB [Streptomyces sp. TverLS-915]|nr:two-component system, OmpR family, sensor histidine kinase MtrB [Streptomyces sp. TverLS-915]
MRSAGPPRAHRDRAPGPTRTQAPPTTSPAAAPADQEATADSEATTDTEAVADQETTAEQEAAVSRRPRLPSFGGLRGRMVLAFALVAVVSALGTGALTFREARNGLLQRSQDGVVDQFRDEVGQVVPGFATPAGQDTLTELASRLVSGHRAQSWRVVATYGGLRADAGNGPAPELIGRELRGRVETHSVAVFQRVRARSGTVLVVGLPVTYAGDSRGLSGLSVYLIVPQSGEEAYVAALVSAVERAALPSLGLAVLLALLLARGVLRPVRELRGAQRRMAEGDLGTRLRVQGSDELAGLAGAFNETAAALEKSVAELRRMEARARRFAADVSHELRTPLAAMTAVTDVLAEEAPRFDEDTADAVRLVTEETMRLARLVEDLMEISRFDAGAVELHADDLDLAESVRRTLSTRGWTGRVETELPAGVRARVDPRRLDVVVANLVGNALKHGAAPVRLALRPLPSPRGVEIEVSDRGPGVPEAALPHLFDRFFKAGAARTRSESSGLGLAITHENVRLHGGAVTAANRPDGGAVFTVRLPLAPPEDAGKTPEARA